MGSIDVTPTIKLHPYQLWTLGGALLVANNLVHWNRPYYQTSYMARRHKLVTVAFIAAYSYHFLIGESLEHPYLGH